MFPMLGADTRTCRAYVDMPSTLSFVCLSLRSPARHPATVGTEALVGNSMLLGSWCACFFCAAVFVVGVSEQTAHWQKQGCNRSHVCMSNICPELAVNVKVFAAA